MAEGVFVGGGVVCTQRFFDGGGVRGGGDRDIGAVSELIVLQLARTHFLVEGMRNNLIGGSYMCFICLKMPFTS